MIALAPIILITWPPVPLARTAPGEPPMSAVSHYCSSFYQILRDCHFSSISTAALKAENKRRGMYALGIYLNCPIFLPHSNTTLLRIYGLYIIFPVVFCDPTAILAYVYSVMCLHRIVV